MTAREGLAFANPSQTAHIRVMHRTFAPHVHMGAVVGAYIQRFAVEDFRYVGGALDWLTPFTVLTGLGLMAGYALPGSL